MPGSSSIAPVGATQAIHRPRRRQYPGPVSFLPALNEDELAAFRALGRVRRFGRGEIIFREGDDPGGVAALLSGQVKVSVSGAGGREVVLRFSGPGDLLGELAAIAGN